MDNADETTQSTMIKPLRVLLILAAFGSTFMLLFLLVGSAFNDQPVYDNLTWLAYASWIVPISILVIALAAIGTSQNQGAPQAQKTLLISFIVILLMTVGLWAGSVFANPCAPNTKTVLTSCHYAWVGKDRAGTLTDAYQIRKDGAYYVDKEIKMATKIEGADVGSFVVDGVRGYAKDAQHVYWNTNGVDFHILADATPATFQFLENDPKHYYAKDSLHVYLRAVMIPDADPHTFQVIEGGKYSRDATRVFFTPCTECKDATATIIQGADAESFYVSPDEEDYIGHDKYRTYKLGR